jgi:hypothetical protein
MPVFDLGTRTPEDLAQEIASGAHGDLMAVTQLAREFKACADRAEKDFIVFLRGLELSNIWTSTDAGTFISYVVRNHIISPDRYANGVRTLNLVPATVITTISFAAAKEVSRIADPVRRDEGVQRMVQWAADRGRPPSAQETKTLLGLRSVAQPTPQAARLQNAETEIAGLRAEVDRLRALVVSLGGDPDDRSQAAE